MSSSRHSVAQHGIRAAAQVPLASWYTQGISDGLGDRLLMSDNASDSSLELLRFRPELAGAPGFERILRDTVSRRAGLEHVAFSRVRSVEYLDSGGLALVSTHVPGRRLSEVFQNTPNRIAVHPAFVAWLIRWLTPALADLTANTGQAHGLITPERIVLAPDGRPVLVEHVLARGIDHLGLSRYELWQQFGIVAPPSVSGPGRTDDRTDIFQLASVSLSLLLGRRLSPTDHAGNLNLLLDEFASSAEGRSSSFTAPLCLWLERALRTDGRGFHSAREACDGVRALSHAPRPDLLELKGRRGPVAFGSHRAGGDQPLTVPDRLKRWARAPLAEARSVVEAHRFATALAIVVVLQMIAIVVLLQKQQPEVSTIAAVRIESPEGGGIVVVDGQEVGVTPFELQVGPSTRTISVRSASPSAGDTTGAAPAREAAASQAQERSAPVVSAGVASTPAAPPRPTGFRVVSPIELQVFDGERQVGSSTGTITLAAGAHELDFVNTALGYRSRQTVVVRNGEVRTVEVQPPGGRVSINAVPWAQVWIDGKPAGETPIAYLPIAAGEHEIVFRHPELGEHRETLVMQSGVEARISASFPQ
ncbi:MAG: hypothetical protein AB7F99_05860 [Vicinamibacterales bacterium]